MRIYSKDRGISKRKEKVLSRLVQIIFMTILFASMHTTMFASAFNRLTKTNVRIFKKYSIKYSSTNLKPKLYKGLYTLKSLTPLSILGGASAASAYYLYHKERKLEPAIPGHFHSIQALPGMDICDMECGVRWMDENERMAYKVHPNEGKILTASNQVLHMSKPGIFVMSPSGEIFIYEYLISPAGDRIRHSSLSLGMPVAAAGDILIHHGVVIGLTNISGHYWPDLELHQQVIDIFTSWGVFSPEQLPSHCAGGLMKHGKIFVAGSEP